MTTERIDKGRLGHFDFLSAFFVIEIIIHHAFQWAKLTSSPFYSVTIQALPFYMPWFYFKSGYFSISSRITLDKIKVDCQRLVVPMISWSIISLCILCVFKSLNGEPVWKDIISLPYLFLRYGYISTNSPLWFLSSLFISRAVLHLSAKLPFTFVAPISLCCGFLLEKYSIVLPFGLSTIPLGFLFLRIGLLARQKSLYSPNTIIGLICLCAYVAIILVFGGQFDFRSNTISNGNYLSYVALSIIGLYLTSFFSLMPTPEIVKKIGEGSMALFVSHWIVFYVLQRTLVFFDQTALTVSIEFVIISCLLTICAFPILIKLKKQFHYLF